ncbi:hypothetical protein PUN28_011623 [Cardiocondyla obscurior]|uniref:Secreted protein n=1 Tax=Cardiocondyla obscurior TaxID=286306 RepID=A0AAW2FG88_9HYME
MFYLLSLSLIIFSSSHSPPSRPPRISSTTTTTTRTIPPWTKWQRDTKIPDVEKKRARHSRAREVWEKRRRPARPVTRVTGYDNDFTLLGCRRSQPAACD